MKPRTNSEAHINALSELALSMPKPESALMYIKSLSDDEFGDLVKYAESNHVVVRAFQPAAELAAAAQDISTRGRALALVDRERSRIETALEVLSRVCDVLERRGCTVTVLKSLDHWPDIGNDLDLYTDADARLVASIMAQEFDAELEKQSWGDMLASKQNFRVAGLSKPFEIHTGRLGQTGEHKALARRFTLRRIRKAVGSYTFYVPAPEEQILAATLQRMYRHLFFRVCDMVNIADLSSAAAIDFVELERAANQAGIWEGVATFLSVVSDYVRRYRGHGLDLPATVLRTAQPASERLSVRGRFLRLPVMGVGAGLYSRQIMHGLRRGDLQGVARLSLLPPLASAALIAYSATGSNKGIW